MPANFLRFFEVGDYDLAFHDANSLRFIEVGDHDLPLHDASGSWSNPTMILRHVLASARAVVLTLALKLEEGVVVAPRSTQGDMPLISVLPFRISGSVLTRRYRPSSMQYRMCGVRSGITAA